MVDQRRGTAESFLECMKKSEFTIKRGPKFCFQRVDSALLAVFWGTFQESCLKSLQKGYHVHVKMYVGSQVASQAKIIFQGPQGFWISQETDGF